MKRYTQPNCVWCGKFISWKHFVSWTNFGGPLDFEPRDETFCCVKCWTDPAKAHWKPTQTWLGPYEHHMA